MKRQSIPILAGGVLLAAAACSPDAGNTPFSPDLSPAFAVSQRVTIEVCKLATFSELEPGHEDSDGLDPNPAALGTYNFRYQIDGGTAVPFQLAAVLDITDCVNGSYQIAIPSGTEDLLVQELPTALTDGKAVLHRVTSTTAGADPCEVTPTIVNDENSILGEGEIDFNGTNCDDGGRIYFKNTFMEGPPPPPPPAVGRMTGGGIQFNQDGVKVTRGLTLHCDIVLSNNLEINWPKDGSNGRSDTNNWHLSRPLQSAECIDLPEVSHGQPPAPFDRFIGTGWGKLNGVPGAYIEFEFTDHGEPGKDDTSMIKIWAPGANPLVDAPVLYVARSALKGGNFQVHCDQPHGSNSKPCFDSNTG